MTRMYLIRHGECDGQGTYVGSGTDIPLNAEGKSAIGRLGETLRTEGIKPISMITSTLQRARQSGSILAEKLGYTTPLSEDSRLNEMDFGQWEGLTYKEICRDYPDESHQWVKDNWNNSPPRGESTKEMAKRVTAFYQDILLPHDDNKGDIILVGHGGSLRMLLCLFMGKSPKDQWQFKLDRSGIAVIEICGDTPVLCRLG